MQKLINLTPHDLDLHLNDERILKVSKKDTVIENLPRVTVSYEADVRSFEIDGEVVEVPYNRPEYGDCINYPEPTTECVYVVSRLFVQGCLANKLPVHHLCSPGSAVRDEKGRVIGSLGLSPAE